MSFPSPDDLPNPGIELTSPALAGGFFTSEPLGKPPKLFISFSKYTRNNVVVIVTVDVNDIEAEFAIVVKGKGHNHCHVSTYYSGVPSVWAAWDDQFLSFCCRGYWFKNLWYKKKKKELMVRKIGEILPK